MADRDRKGIKGAAGGFAEAAANRLTNPALDPESKIPDCKYAAVKVEVFSPAPSESEQDEMA